MLLPCRQTLRALLILFWGAKLFFCLQQAVLFCSLPFQAQGLVIKEEPYTLRVPRSQRGGEIVEPLVREQWFVRMEPLAKPALEVIGPGLCVAMQQL